LIHEQLRKQNLGQTVKEESHMIDEVTTKPSFPETLEEKMYPKRFIMVPFDCKALPEVVVPAYADFEKRCHETLTKTPSNRITSVIRSKTEQSKLMAKWNRDQLIAYDAFLWSEKVRHREDIDAIDKKREVLHRAGFQADEPAPWIHEAEIEEAGKGTGYLKVNGV
jgi:hypothetical protein